MNLPKIDLSALPDLQTLTGLFGTVVERTKPGHDDSIVVLATYIYETSPVGGGIF